MTAPQPTKPVVAWILEASSLSGGVRVIYEMANHTSALGFPTMILSLNETPKWFHINGKIKWLRYGSYETLFAAAKNLRPDVVIGTWWKTAYVTAQIRDEIKCRGMYLVQDIESSYYLDPASRKAVMDTYELGLGHFTTSKWVMSQLPKCEYVGIAIGKWNNRSDRSRQRVVMTCMRRQALKGFRELAEVSRYLTEQGIPLSTFGMDIGIRFSSIHTHNFGEKVLPTDKTLERGYSSCGVFISTSLHEGLALTPLEAMACGAPTVVFDADGNREYAEDNVNCLIATSPRDMADKIMSLLGDRDLARRLSISGLATAKSYTSWEAPIGRLAALLEG